MKSLWNSSAFSRVSKFTNTPPVNRQSSSLIGKWYTRLRKAVGPLNRRKKFVNSSWVVSWKKRTIKKSYSIECNLVVVYTCLFVKSRYIKCFQNGSFVEFVVINGSWIVEVSLPFGLKFALFKDKLVAPIRVKVFRILTCAEGNKNGSHKLSVSLQLLLYRDETDMG